MPENDLTKTVPQAPPRANLEALLERCVRLIEGWTDDEGKRHKGMLERLGDLEDERVKQDEDRKRLEAQRLTWKNGIGLAAAGGVISQAIAWLNAHIK